MKRNNENNSQNIFKKITKVSLVIYSISVVIAFIIFISLSFGLKDFTFLWGFLLCLGPSIIFIAISIFLPFEKIVLQGSSKGSIAVFVLAYIFKYLLIIGIPILGVFFQQYFNRWSILATTLIAPIIAIVIKIIVANIVSKNNKSVEEKPKNTIKF